MGLILNAEAMRVVQKNDKGNVSYRKRYKKGDVVDVSYIDDAQVEALIRDGRLVEQDSDEAEDLQGDSDTPEDSEGQGTPATPSETTTPEDDDEADEPDEEEDFESYDYSTLQRLAKERTGDGSGGKQDLIDRLKAHSESE